MHHDSKQTVRGALSQSLMTDQEAILSDLEELSALSRERRAADRGDSDGLLAHDSIPPLTPPPLQRKAPSRNRGRYLLGTAIAVTCFLAGSASSYGIAGLGKAPVPPAAVILEPPKDPAMFDEEPTELYTMPEAPPLLFADDKIVPEETEELPVAEEADETRAKVRTPRPFVARRPPAPDEREIVPAVAAVSTPPTEAALVTTAALPDAPSRAALLAGLRGASAAVAGCGLGDGGSIFVDVTINGPSGQIDRVAVTDGSQFADPICVARAVRTARFPRFRDDDFAVRSFPYIVR